MRPYFKFSLPGEDESSLETDIWKTAPDVIQLGKLLSDLNSDLGYSNLSTQSQNFLRLKTDEEREEFVTSRKLAELKKQTVITCMSPLPKSLPDEKAISCLVLATESCKLFILDPEGFTIVKEYKTPDVAVHMVAFGLFMVDYTIILACRNGSICLITPKETKVLTELSAHTVGLVLLNDLFVVACMDRTLQGFSFKGKKQWSTKLPGGPMCMTLITLKFLSLHLVAVSCQVSRNDAKAGTLLLYSGPQLVHALIYPNPLSGVLFGQFGLEEHALVTVAVMGAVSAKLLRRTATFGLVGEKEEKWWEAAGPQEPSQIQLMVPKKSKIFVEQTLRERAECKVMHGIFQKSLLQLNADASQMYLHGLTQCSVSQQDALKVTHQVLGLGPKLKLQINIQNVSKEEVLSDMAITFIADPKIHDVLKKYIQVPVLVPGLLVCLETDVVCLASMSSTVTVLVCSPVKVLFSSVINMPLAASVEAEQ
uniref:Bardet-Biedl syndrome 1 protein n=1 Tax=Cacopsylla melanoneura TaxID=428564 RepID=A0A8D9BD26_9HEMI